MHDIYHKLAKLHQHLDGARLEIEIRRGCARCGNPVVDWINLVALPGAVVIHPPLSSFEEGCCPHEALLDGKSHPYCGKCMHELGYSPMPGDDYSI